VLVVYEDYGMSITLREEVDKIGFGDGQRGSIRILKNLLEELPLLGSQLDFHEELDDLPNELGE